MKNRTIKLMIGASTLASLAQAEPLKTVTPENQSNGGDFCSYLQTVGDLYKNKENPYIQSVSIYGRLQAQYAYVSGKGETGNDFNDDFEEVRRLRLGMKIKAFNGFQLSGNVNLEDDNRPAGGERKFGYEDFDQFKLSYTIKDVAGLDSLSLTYGRQKVRVGHEAHTSSKRIKTVERSALSNKISSNRYTGVSLTAKRGDIKGTVGLFSLDQSEFVGNWDAGTAFYASGEFETLGGDVTLDLFYNMDQGSVDDQVGMDYEWVTSAAWKGSVGNWGLMVNAVVGDNGSDSKASREGLFYGLVVMPSTYLIEDKLEFVTRYQFQASDEDQGIRLNSRYTRFSDTSASGRGSSHHSIYAGFNYFFCGHRSKIMTGVEYETIDTTKGDIEATSLWLAYRMYF